jgi:lipase chaperone LimK
VRTSLVVLAAAALAAVALWAQRPPRPAPPPAARLAATDASSPVARTDTAAPPAEAGSALAGRPRSLRGTRIDGGLPVGADGHFVPGPEARRLFDYFLTASGEEPPDQTRARIVAEIARRLPEPAASEAAALLDRYLEYRTRANSLATGGDLTEGVESLARLRAEVLGPADSRALFGDDQAVGAHAAEVARIAADGSLSPDERARRIAALDAELPPAARAARARALGPLALAKAEAQLRAHGASAEDIRKLREETVGPEAAARLAALDERRAEWQRRLDDFRTARQAIESDARLDAAERDRRIQELLTERFTPAERLRVQELGATSGH